MTRRQVKVINDLGLHLRAAGVLARVASGFSSDIHLRRDNQSANAKSIMSILALAAPRGTELELVVEGHDEHQASLCIAELLASGFAER